jgi:hypothetical protein
LLIKRHFCHVLMLVALLWLVAGPVFYASAAPAAALAALSEPETTAQGGLSPYWHAKVQRWEDLILQEASRRELDPDLLASLIWKESSGDALAVGPSGATGLMQVMPKEAGFTWRPTREALLDPDLNVFWGSRTLSIVVEQGEGDIFNALAAYNGGWRQASYRGPRNFAASILCHYARAVAQRHGLTDGWTAVFAVQRAGIGGPIWVAEAGRDDVTHFGDDNVTVEGAPFVPDVAPTSIVASCAEAETRCEVGVWIFDRATQQWLGPQTSPAVHATAPDPSAASIADPAPDERPRPSVVVMAGSSRPVTGVQSSSEPQATSELPTCSGEPLTLAAWPLDSAFTAATETEPAGWKVRIYVEARGGDCVYSYAWNDASDIRVANVQGSATFEVTSTRRDAVIVGTVVVLSGEHVRRVPLYIPPPK